MFIQAICILGGIIFPVGLMPRKWRLLVDVAPPHIGRTYVYNQGWGRFCHPTFAMMVGSSSASSLLHVIFLSCHGP